MLMFIKEVKLSRERTCQGSNDAMLIVFYFERNSLPIFYLKGFERVPLFVESQPSNRRFST